MTCDFPYCDNPAAVLLANNVPPTSPHYAERWTCSRHDRPRLREALVPHE